MKREYYDSQLGIFLAGMITGMILLCVFLTLKKFGYDTLGWIIMGSTGGMLCAAWGMSYVLNRTHAIDELEAAESISHIAPAPSGTFTPEPEPLLIPRPHSRDAPIDTGELTFPYTTRALSAAQQATVKFWIGYDPERPPLQKSVQSFISEQGIPIRQAAELASAIKPDNVSDRSDIAVSK
ncbi:hypothetical protein FGE05_10900 [Pseudomonas sp. ICMP22404]|uniref:hypothetical protein n=1 Tax=Pseudomonas sp. ICMP22404 TaxID=2583807 RepID=UPI00111A55C7|nr:hypothetical protein [Pseudomonas sp. ICMP22404]TNF82810.1 hypothetical protein FGE05_10900 [Pseudomonas sp. ICMP22404]